MAICIACILDHIHRVQCSRFSTTAMVLFLQNSHSESFSLKCFDSVGLATGKASDIKMLDVGLLVVTGALHVLWLQLSPSPPSSLAPIKSRMETFCWDYPGPRGEMDIIMGRRESWYTSFHY